MTILITFSNDLLLKVRLLYDMHKVNTVKFIKIILRVQDKNLLFCKLNLLISFNILYRT